MLVRYLGAKGHRSVAGIFKSDDRQGPERYSGFVSEIVQKKLPLEEEHICWYDTAGREALLEGHADWLERFAGERLSPCTAVVCYNDEIAYALERCLLGKGLRVSEDIAVVSFDNSHLCSLSPVPLTSLSHERHQLGSSAAEALLRMIRQKPASGASFPWSLRERVSG